MKIYLQFFVYSLKLILGKQKRQNIIILAMLGLTLSSFALLCLQSVMSGLQTNLVERAKDIEGSFVVVIGPQTDPRDLIDKLEFHQMIYSEELVLEQLIRLDRYFFPIIIHGINFNKFIPDYLKNKNDEGIILGSDLARKLKATYGKMVEIYSPLEMEDFLGEVPRTSSLEISDFVATESPEIDSLHTWVKLSFLQNSIRQSSINTLRFFHEDQYQLVSQIVEDLKKNNPAQDLRLITWQEKNNHLDYALKLETRVMMFLFSSMSLLLSLSIGAGLLIFFNKIKIELSAFYILGKSMKDIFQLLLGFILGLNFIFCFLGICLGLMTLFFLDHFAPDFFPQYFVEARLPVKISLMIILKSFAIPFLICAFFSYLSFWFFKKNSQQILTQIKRQY